MKQLTGTWSMTRLALRRDRVMVPAWAAVFVLSIVSSAYATVGLYPDPASRTKAASAVNDIPALVALYGRIWDPTSLGALSIMKLSGLVAALLAVFAVMLVVRHTRAEEENGRLELLGSTVLGRRAALTAALMVAAGSMLLIGVLTAVGQTTAGLPAAGSWAFGLALATTGMSYAAVAAVTAQLTIGARSAIGAALTVLAVTYVLRAVGDVAGDADGSAVWSWMSPVGWGQQVRPYAGDRWWVLIIPVVFCSVTFWLAYVLASRRDLGAGLLPDRPGPAQAAPWMSSPLALAWRLQRAVLLGWAVAYVILGLVFGAIASDVGTMLDSPQAQDMITRLGGTHVLTDAFMAMELSISGFITAAFGISAAMRLHAEESTGHAEPVLAVAVPRNTWLTSHVVIAVAGTTVLTLLLGVSAGVANAVQLGSTDRLWAVVGGALVQLPAVWVMTGLTVFLFGYAPRLVVAAWAALVGFILVEEIGALLELPLWLQRLSPFAHLPKLPGADMSWPPLILVLAVAVVLVALGALGFSRRDLDTP
ncbi:MAG: ABC transporter permease [Actinomycetes bacterium]